ncbi:hexosaminidase D-like isoform X3 [Branchiostoma lanceolatum]|uniref:hexosaminidase D-like isoform X3 n=1 Tax=Branchiostoma lanceolatum TaxID=7740 RepID=UPI0034541F51
MALVTTSQKEEVASTSTSVEEAMETEEGSSQTGASAERQNPKHRLVHLDLKGAPPKLSYLAQVIPLFKKFGATGLLVEYEDMFPYNGELRDLAAAHAYSQEEIQQLQELAKEHDMLYVPLVQTFGHFEFVLKHDTFRHLREVDMYPMALCPSNTESIVVVKKMIDQLMAAHPDVRYLHIGADEVFHLALCKTCKLRLAEQTWTDRQLFLDHIMTVLSYIKVMYPNVKAIMWDDMLRETSMTHLQAYGIGEMVEPMVWCYLPRLSGTFLTVSFEDLWKKYAAVFKSAWIGTAFKGATGSSQYIVPINYHLQNHMAWLAQLDNIPSSLTVQGWALTGWSRYDHYATHCELLPAAIPCLALCLQTVVHGGFTEDCDFHRKVSEELGFSQTLQVQLVPKSVCAVSSQHQCVSAVMMHNQIKTIAREGTFPGAKLFQGVHVLVNLDADYIEFLNGDSRYTGWMTDYHVRKNFTNPCHLEFIIHMASRLQEEFTKLHREMDRTLSEMYDPSTVEEWLVVHFKSPIDKLSEILGTAKTQIERYSSRTTCSS